MKPPTRIARFASIAGALALLMSLASCLPVPLGDPEKSQVDPKLTGVWHFKQDDGGTLIAIAPADSHTYVIQMLDYKKAADGPTAGKSTVLRGWLTEIKGERFITGEMMAQMVDPTTTRKDYAIFRLRMKPEGAEITGLAEKYDGFKDVNDAAALAKVIEANLNDPTMYTESSTFVHLDPAKEADQPLIGLISR